MASAAVIATQEQYMQAAQVGMRIKRYVLCLGTMLTSVGGLDLGLRGGDAGDGHAVHGAAQGLRAVLAEELDRPDCGDQLINTCSASELIDGAQEMTYVVGLPSESP
jgi:hypothetical protein